MQKFILAGAAALGLFFIPCAQAQNNWFDSAAQTWRDGKNTHQILLENDSLLLKKDDGMFTSGNRYQLQSWLGDASGSRVTQWFLGHDMYTALDIKLPPSQIQPPDHPYAAWLYSGMQHRRYRADGSMLGFGLTLGCLGPCAAGEAVQTRLHRLINQPLPQAWSRQVKNEWGAIVDAAWAGQRIALGENADLQPAAQARFGNIHTDLAFSGTLRAGQRNALPQQQAFYAYLQGQARVVGYDATMQGGYFSKNNPHTVAPKRVVGQLQAGLQWVGTEYALKLAVYRVSNTIRDLPNSKGMQNIGVIELSYTP